MALLTIKELAGHRSVETTTRYLHLSDAPLRQAIKALEARGELGETGALEEARSSVTA